MLSITGEGKLNKLHSPAQKSVSGGRKMCVTNKCCTGVESNAINFAQLYYLYRMDMCNNTQKSVYTQQTYTEIWWTDSPIQLPGQPRVRCVKAPISMQVAAMNSPSFLPAPELKRNEMCNALFTYRFHSLWPAINYTKIRAFFFVQNTNTKRATFGLCNLLDY